jgi:hypothetical protein
MSDNCVWQRIKLAESTNFQGGNMTHKISRNLSGKETKSNRAILVESNDIQEE